MHILVRRMLLICVRLCQQICTCRYKGKPTSSVSFDLKMMLASHFVKHARVQKSSAKEIQTDQYIH